MPLSEVVIEGRLATIVLPSSCAFHCLSAAVRVLTVACHQRSDLDQALPERRPPEQRREILSAASGPP